MLVVQVIESFGSGTLQVVSTLAAMSHAEGWQTVVFHGLRDETPKDFPALFPQGTKFIKLKTGRAINGIWDLSDAMTIAAFAKKHKAALIHGHSSKGGALSRAASLMSGTPGLYTPHGFSFLTEKGPSKTKLTYWLEKGLGVLPATLVCCSQSEAKIANDFSAKVAVVPNFIDLSALKAAGAEAGGCDIVMAGRISAQKNATLFMATARLLPQYRFLWLGGPASELEGDIPANVEVSGWVTRETALRRMAGAKVYLSTSRYEGMPIAMLEAQALGLPVVSTKVLGSVDIVADGVNGRFADTAEDMAAALKELLENDALRATYGRQAQAILNERHNPQTLTGEWARIYRAHARA